MGYIPQSKLSVNLDDIYVKKPCPMSALIEIQIGKLSTALSGIVPDLDLDIDLTTARYLFDEDMTDTEGMNIF